MASYVGDKEGEEESSGAGFPAIPVCAYRSHSRLSTQEFMGNECVLGTPQLRRHECSWLAPGP